MNRGLALELHRPDPAVLRSLDGPCRLLLHDRAAFDDHYLSVLDSVLPGWHLLREAPGLALEVMDVVLRAVLSGQSPDSTEAECSACGERCADAGLPDDVFVAVGRALVWTAREAAGEAWTAAMSSGWVAVQLWVQPHLMAGAARARVRAGARGEVWHSFPELAPTPGGAAAADSPRPTAPPPAPADAATEWSLLDRVRADQVRADQVRAAGQRPGGYPEGGASG
jgi:hypothetical protein